MNGKNQVRFNGEEYSVSGLAKKILTEKFGWTENLHVNGWIYFTKDGTSLNDLRTEAENPEDEA